MLPAQLSQYPILSVHSTAADLTSLVLFDKILRLCDKILMNIAALVRTSRHIKKEWNAPRNLNRTTAGMIRDVHDVMPCKPFFFGR
jgi:hypothetical protein